MGLNLQNHWIIWWMAILFTLCVSGFLVRELHGQIMDGRYRRLAGWLLLWGTMIGALSVVLPLGGFAKLDRVLAQKVKPLVVPPWREGLKWMRSNLPENATIASNWDYGSMINGIGKRKTIVDADHYLPYQIHLAYRHIFCAQSDNEALQFLKSHEVTHLALRHESFFKLGSISFIAADANYDRLAQPAFLAGPISYSESAEEKQWQIPLRRRPLKSKAIGWMQKPPDFEELASLIHRMLERQ